MSGNGNGNGRKKFTVDFVLRRIGLAKASGKRIEDPVPDAPKLYLITQPSGVQSWALRYPSPVTGKSVKFTFAKVSVWSGADTFDADDSVIQSDGLSIEQARERAIGYRDQLSRGIDPAIASREAKATRAPMFASSTPSVDELFRSYLVNYPLRRGKRARASSIENVGFLLGLRETRPSEWDATGRGVLAHWSGKPLRSITRRDTNDLIEKIGKRTPRQANTTLSALKTFAKWAVEREELDSSAAFEIRAKYEDVVRERVLTADEIRALWRACTKLGYPYGEVPPIILLTSQRPGEALLAPWSEFGSLDDPEALWTIPGERTKNRRLHRVPLTAPVITRLKALPRRGAFLFQAEGASKPIAPASIMKTKLDELMLEELRRGDPTATLPRWTYHDLRRTGSSIMQELGVEPWIIDAVQNHAPPTKIMRTYQRYDYLAERREALDALARHIMGIVELKALPSPALALPAPL